MWEKYFSPSTVEEALELLKSNDGRARIIAGGTDLVVELKAGVRTLVSLVDITGIESLKRIEMIGDQIRIGACVTHTEVGASSVIQASATALSEAALSVGSPQTRNIGTVVGNLVSAQPAADAAVALVALGAEAEVANGTSSEWRPVEDLYLGIGVSRVKSNEEIVTGIRFKAQQGNQGSAFTRLALREALALPVVNTAVKITAGVNNTCAHASIVVAPVAPHPYRCKKAEDFLTGVSLTMESLARAAEEAAREANPRDSALRGTAEYRREMIKVLVRRAICKAVDRIKPQYLKP